MQSVMSKTQFAGADFDEIAKQISVYISANPAGVKTSY